MLKTTNYNLPTYEDDDNPDLITGYNAAVTAIDTQMKTNADAIAKVSLSTPSINYVKLTVAELAKGINIAYKE